MPEPSQIEEDLVALISKEQRSFRSMLFAGLGAIVVLVAISAASGVYYSRVSERLQQTQESLQQEAFNARRDADQQNNRMSAQERRLNRIHDQIRSIAGSGQTTASEADAIRAAEAYLFRGHRLTLGEESAIARAAQHATQPGLQAFLSAVAGLNTWNQRNNEAIDNNANGLPRDLRAIREQFIAARTADPAFSARSSAGIAWIDFLEASATYSSYSAQHCDALATAIAGATPGGPQLTWWRAQCDRKLGRTSDALGNYAQLLEQTWRTAFTTNDEGEMVLAMNGFHGVGTTLIVLNDASDAVVQQWLPMARQACAPEGEALMDVAIACLGKAIEMRERIGQTDNEVSGTRENLGFAYLRAGDVESAFRNSETVAETGLFAWNELVRALVASQMDGADAETASESARRNIRFFGIGEFNPCEIQKLLNEDQFERALEILSDAHSAESVRAAVEECAAL